MDKGKVTGHVAVITANVIFGLGVPVTKYLLQGWVSPMVYMLTRCVGAALIFWLIAAFLPKEHVERCDLVVIMLSGLLGFVISQTLTAWALNYTSPVYFSLIATLTPVAVMLLAAAFLGEKMSAWKVTGVLLGIAGAVVMVLMSSTMGSGSNDVLGIVLALLSLLTWAVYLIVTRRVSQKYTPVSQMKWVFLVSAIAVVPFSYGEVPASRLYAGGYGWEGLAGIGAMAFIVLFATVLGYFLIPLAMRYLKATTVSVYTNLQPVVASLVAIAVGQDVLTWDKPLAAVLVLVSAWMVTKDK